MSIRTIGRLAAMICVAGPAPLALGQPSTPATSPSPAAPTNPANPAGPGTPSSKPRDPERLQVWTESQPILDREMEVLRKATSMVGKSTQKFEMHVAGQAPVSRETIVEFAVAKPDKFIIRQPDLEVMADGRTLVVHSKALKQYVKLPQPDPWLLREKVEELTSGQIRSIPGEVVLRPGMSLEQTLRNVRTIERTRAGDIGDRPGQWVSGTQIDERTPGSLPFSFERWFSDADGLTYQLIQDLTASYQDQHNRVHAENHEGEANPPPPPKVNHARWTITYTREMNAEIPAAQFEFKPGKDDRQVDALVWPHPGMRAQLAMINKPCPEVTGPDLDGRTVSVSGERGKIVVLDFWATWCGPCVAGLPSMQALKTRYQGRGVAFLGVNRDAEDKKELVKRYLAKRGVDIRQVLDGAQGPAANAFGASTIPCVVLVDQEGVVRDIDVGYVPGKEKELEAKIEKLLTGRPIRTEGEWEKLREQVDAVEKGRSPG